ncbi:MAG: hypothetical protein AAF717_22855 [Bacteroidota bacterium]
MNKGKTMLIAAFVGVGLLLVITVSYMPIWGDDDDQRQQRSAVPRLEQQQTLTLEEMTTFVPDDYEVSEEDIQVNNPDSITAFVKRKLGDTIGRYANEDSEANLLIQKEIERIEAEKRKTAQRSSTAGTTPKKKKLSYEQRLKQAKAEMLEEYQGSDEDIEEYTEPIRFVAKVSPEKGKRVEYVLPGQQRRIRLTLEEDIVIDGRPYALGTRIYARLNIRQSRILFNVSKIGSTPVELKSLDPRDELEGIYSERAGELWAEFENETINNSGSAAAQDFGREFGSPTVGNIARGLVRSLAKKNLSDSEKIPLDNTIKIIFSNQ